MSRRHRSERRAFLSRRRPERDERGFVMVWFAILLVVLLGISAFAVDLGHAYLVAQQAQDAADASALSAASYLPDNCVNADPHAVSVAGANGFANGGSNVVTAVNGAVGGTGCDNDASLSPNQIQVTVKSTFNTFFAGVLGIKTLTVSRSSIAEYDPPVELGSPNSFFGEAPGCTSCASQQPNIWANVVGQENRKVDGNAIYSSWCANSSNRGDGPAADNCPGTGLANSDRDTDGMLFEISNPKLEPLNLELFDPGFASDGKSCPVSHAVYPFCTGDEGGLPVANDNAPPLQTTYTLYPLDNLANPLGNAALCHVTYPGYTSVPFPAGANDLTTRSFQKWANFGTDAGCPALSASSYVLQVQAGDMLGHPAEQGSNDFSIAACSGCGTNQPTLDPNVDISAITKMALSANVPPSAPTSQPSFYLARVPSWAKGQVLTLNFFDVGDISNAGGDQLAGTIGVSAVDATHGSGGALVGQFANCTYSHPDTRGNAAGDYISGQTTPWDPNPSDTAWARNPTSLSPMGGGCTAAVDINNATGASFWNGKWATFKVPIPSDYTCTDRDLTKCWLKINYNFPGAQFHDTTTWTASLSGNPVRLTK